MFYSCSSAHGDICVSQGVWPLLVTVTPAPLSSEVCGGLPLGEARVKHNCWQCCLVCCDPWLGGSGESWLLGKILPVFVVGCSFSTCGVSWVNWSCVRCWRRQLQKQLLFSLMINFLHTQTQLCLKYCEWSVCLAAWDLLLGCGVKLAKPSLTNISTFKFLHPSDWMLLMGPQHGGWAHQWPFGSRQSYAGWWTPGHSRVSCGDSGVLSLAANGLPILTYCGLYICSLLESGKVLYAFSPSVRRHFWSRKQQL